MPCTLPPTPSRSTRCARASPTVVASPCLLKLFDSDARGGFVASACMHSREIHSNCLFISLRSDHAPYFAACRLLFNLFSTRFDELFVRGDWLPLFRASTALALCLSQREQACLEDDTHDDSQVLQFDAISTLAYYIVTVALLVFIGCVP